ncbi:hypothetical protein IGI04_010069 [Brassica rapa subsp. trilocularis]|uniref:Glucose-methanol-choline oxidoreductase N-terminal domain-containing protein n=1 Tax=Brassica rapa subsp. trilocularis TaxID=1813537 RepID=A0ABQ7MZ47_BRACM|nr:hypothetical protein IGI04_010069 [Brassica rapa subsp. trilocularis]
MARVIAVKYSFQYSSFFSLYVEKGHYTFMKDATLAPTYASFDYILIGGGTSGCALAATLSQNARVLVLERGGSPYDNPTASDLGNFANTLFNITPNSWSQLFISEDGVYNTRARVLGGGSVINAGFYTRAGDDYVEEVEWEREAVEAAYEWVEKKLVFEPHVMGWQTAFKDGLLEAGVNPYNGFTYDHIYGTKIGGTIFDGAGHRHTAANLLEYANPDNIVVYLHASVQKILFTKTDGPRPEAYQVIFEDTKGVLHKVELANNPMNEVILSAGAIGSPHLLMLSGVGPMAHLAAHGVKPVILDHPMVGQGMGDNPMSPIFIPSPTPEEMSLVQAVGITKFDNYIEGGNNVTLSFDLTRRFFDGVLHVLNETSRTTSTKILTQPIVDFLRSLDRGFKDMIAVNGMFQKVAGPASRGYMELRNRNPDDNPSVTFNYYQEPEDLNKCVEGLKTIIKVIDSKAFTKYKYPDVTARVLLNFMLGLPTNLRPRHVTSMFNLKQFCIDNVMTVWHYHGGCQVGKVVDKNYKVLGIDALRVIDGSTFLKSPGTNPQATVMMLGSLLVCVSTRFSTKQILSYTAMGFHMFPSVLVIIFILHGSSYSHKDKGFYGFMKDATSAPTYARFDYIVIGGGTSGCSLAATLSQNASVLVLERGGSPYDNPRATDIENVANTLLNITPNSWSQPFISEDGVYNTRARVLGGDSVLNAGFYSRAEEYYVKEAEWEMEEVEAAYEWVERKLVFEPQVTGWQSALKDGLLEAGVLPYNGFTFKHIIGTKIGGSTFDSAGHKHSAADLLEYANPDKIAVYLHATVHKILFTTKGNQRPKAYGMIYQDADGMFHKVELAENAMNEVILSAGALGSPQLLMLSGVGPRAHLEAQGVDPVVIDHPMVGQGMGDNPMNSVIVPSPQPVELSLPQVVGITRFGNFIEGFSGLSLSYNLTRMFFETRLSTQSITSFINSSDFQLNLIEIDGVIFQKVDGPFSRGYLELRNTNPDDNPSVTFNYYQEPEDLEKCVKGLETIIEVINSNAFSKYKYLNATGRELLNRMLGLPTNLRPRHVTSVFNLRQFCIDTVMSVWHYHGGCQVGRVVDKDYKVLGIDALRVIDGSTFLKSPGTNPQATVMMLGRYMGQKILRERNASGEKRD